MKLSFRYIVLAVALILFVASLFYSVKRYRSVTIAGHENVVMQLHPEQGGVDSISEDRFKPYLGVNTYSMYDVLKTRNVFARSAPGGAVQVPAKPASVAMQVMPLPVIEKKPQTEAPKVKKATAYFYQGTMMLNGKKAHIVEQTEPYKTHFLCDGIPSDGLQIIEVGRYGITIQDKNKKTYELPIKKE